MIRYIKANYSDSICIFDSGKLLNVYNDYLIRLFNDTISITPTKYINNVRLEEMQKLLTNTDIPITAISYMVGFSNVNYIAKFFKGFLD